METAWLPESSTVERCGNPHRGRAPKMQILAPEEHWIAGVLHREAPLSASHR